MAFEDDGDWPPEPKGGDDDVYEDSQDLDTSEQGQRVMLVRLPEYLMAQLRDNAGKLSGAELGRVFIPQANSRKLSVSLNTRHDVLNRLPHRYDVAVTNAAVKNVFVLKEEAAKRRADDDAMSTENKRAKKTSLIGHAVNECVMTADPKDENYRYVLEQRKLMEQPDVERQTTLLENLAGVGGSKYGATLRQQKDAWLKPAQRRQIARQSAEGKAIRVARHELLDMLFRAFESQPYWTIKQLRERTRQPEQYLRSVLDSIATLIKRGPYAMRYGLKEEFKTMQSSGASVENLVERAPDGPEMSEEESDEEMEMENVELAD